MNGKILLRCFLQWDDYDKAQEEIKWIENGLKDLRMRMPASETTLKVSASGRKCRFEITNLSNHAFKTFKEFIEEKYKDALPEFY